jgi:hypothetical protein
MADLGAQISQLSPEQRQAIMVKAQQEANQQVMQEMMKQMVSNCFNLCVGQSVSNAFYVTTFVCLRLLVHRILYCVCV